MRENWDKIEDIYGECDTHLIHFVTVEKNTFVILKILCV